MACNNFKSSDGARGIVCSRGRKMKLPPCSEPQCGGPGVFLCDFPITSAGKKLAKKGKHVPERDTCSRKICPSHATPMGIPGDLHYCPSHVREDQAGKTDPQEGQLDLFRNPDSKES